LTRKAVDLLLVRAGQLVTLAGPARPRAGREQGELAILPDGAVAVARGVIVDAGPTRALRARYAAKEVVDARGAVVTPGLVDPHTHAVFAGSREREFEARAAGKSYREIAEAGGGILSTVEATRRASKADLLRGARARIRAMLAQGTTTVEIKSGYGLTARDEIKSLEAARDVGGIPTFLGAHAVPKGRTSGAWLNDVTAMLPRVRKLARFCDVFCEPGAFSLAESRKVLEAAKRAGLGLKIHAEEFEASGGAELAAELGAVSADHLMAVTDRGIAALARAGTIAVLLPGTSVFLGGDRAAPARALIAAGVPVALGTDCNPGSCTATSLPLVMTLATARLKMSPAEALAACTVNAAWACGEGARAGTIEAGKRADLVVWAARDYREIPYWFGATLAARVFRAGRSCIPPAAR
jgi:imidazolonepropionase